MAIATHLLHSIRFDSIRERLLIMDERVWLGAKRNLCLRRGTNGQELQLRLRELLEEECWPTVAHTCWGFDPTHIINIINTGASLVLQAFPIRRLEFIFQSWFGLISGPDARLLMQQSTGQAVEQLPTVATSSRAS